MVDRSQIKPQMDVVASDGSRVGRVEGVEGQAIRLTAQAESGGGPQVIPLEWVVRVADQVHLNIDSARLASLKGGRVVSVEDAPPPRSGTGGISPAAGAAGAAIGAVSAGAAGHIEPARVAPTSPGAAAAAPRPPAPAPATPPAGARTGPAAGTEHDDAASPLPPIRNPAVKGARPRSNYYLPWILALLGTILLLVLMVRACAPEERAAGVDPAVGPASAPREATPAGGGDRPAPLVTGLTTGTLAYDLNTYLASGGAAERTFVFDRLNFRSGSSRLRREDQEDVEDIARVLAAYPDVRIAVVGYTDASGSGEANVRLGFERATAVVGALAERGVSPDRMVARSGGEQAPLAANEQAEGRAENRRTELIVLGR